MGNLRRSRGYNFEYKIAQFFNEYDNNWRAQRYSPPMPDVVLTYNNHIFGVEAKNSGADVRHIPIIQLNNAQDKLNVFRLYNNHYVVCIWQFMSKSNKSKLTGKGSRREIKTYILVYDENLYNQLRNFFNETGIISITCTYKGRFRYRTNKTYSLKKGEKKDITIQDKLDETDLNQELSQKYGFSSYCFTSLEEMALSWSKP